MQVILLERVAKLGQMGEIVNVKDGYARNYLLPQKKALWASEANVKHFETEKAQLEARNLETKKEAESLRDMAGNFPALYRNTRRILASIKMLEMNLSDVSDLL